MRVQDGKFLFQFNFGNYGLTAKVNSSDIGHLHTNCLNSSNSYSGSVGCVKFH